MGNPDFGLSGPAFPYEAPIVGNQSDMANMWDNEDIGAVLLSADVEGESDNITSAMRCVELPYHYRLKKTSLLKSYAFRLPLVLLLIEILIIIVLRSVIAVITYRRRLVKIFVATATPILNEHYYDNPPVYPTTVSTMQPPGASVVKTTQATHQSTDLKSAEPRSAAQPSSNGGKDNPS
uniref:Integral membrane protein n=1 Tax=Panagrellus redivivus TaxID=6233 RepID=A0A7E4W6P0_PANRE